MDKSESSACHSRLSDLKSFYPSKKSPRNQLTVSDKTAFLCNESHSFDFIAKDENFNFKSRDSVVTIDLSDDSIIEADILGGGGKKNETLKSNDVDIKGVCIDVISVTSSDNCDINSGDESDDSVGTLVPTSPVKPTSTRNYNFSDSDDDSFLDIPLSQRLGLTEDKFAKLPLTKETISETSEDVVQPVTSLLGDDSIETWAVPKDPVLSSPGKSSPRKSPRKFSVSHEKSPMKKPTDDFKKLEKRPYQSDTPPNKTYTSLKEKNLKADGLLSTFENEKDEDFNQYQIEEIITPKERKRRIAEEVAKSKEDKERKKAEKAEEKKIREKMKAKEKEKKAALREAGRAKLLANCYKFCKTYVDVGMVEKFKITDELQTVFREKDAKLFLETNNPIENGIHWVQEQRDIMEDEIEDESTINIIRHDVESDIILKVLAPHDYIPLVNSSLSKIELESSDSESDDEIINQTLYEYVTSLLDLYDKNLTLILFGFDKYTSQLKNRENAEYRAKMGLAKRRTNKNKDTLPCVKKSDLDLALFDLQVKLTESIVYSSKRVHIIQTETPSDLCHIIWCHTKATAMCSIKKSQREQQGLEWYAQNDLGSVDVNTNRDISSLWTKQLMSFTKMSEEMAKAVTEVYPCPQALLTAYTQCNDETEKETLLSGIEVNRKNYTTGSTVKKLGPQISRRIYLFMTTRDGDTIID